MEKIYLKPGNLIVAEEPVMVTTVLGSCISVTMFHRKTGIAAICHAMMPNGGSGDSFRYVDTAVHYMAMYFERHEIPRKEINVKLFGGAEMFNCTDLNNQSVGRQNILVAKRCLHEHNFVLAASDIGGRKGRKLIFKTDTGIVFLKKQSSQESECCLELEEK